MAAFPASFVLEVVVWRGAIAESCHRVRAAVARDEPAPASAGGAEYATTFRSAATPFQLLPLVERGHADRFGFSAEQLAIMAASHTGTERHVALVRAILDRIGLSERDLACGFHEPFDEPTAARLRAGSGARSALYNNCSGKHAGMLALALAEGWPTAGYERESHPVQRAMRAAVAEACGMSAPDLSVGIDGCNAVVFGLPLRAMALGYARFASAAGGDDPRRRALARIRDAMTAHAWATGGAGRLSTELMERTSGRLVAKGGAEGLECIGAPALGLGVALKCEDGAARALGPAAVTVLEHVGALAGEDPARLESLRRPVLRNHVGLEVGRIEARLDAVADGNPAATPSVSGRAATPGRTREPMTS